MLWVSKSIGKCNNVAGTNAAAITVTYTFTGTKGIYCTAVIGTSSTVSGSYTWTSSTATAFIAA